MNEVQAVETLAQQLAELIERLGVARDNLNRTPPARHASVAITHLEDGFLRLAEAVRVARANTSTIAEPS